MLESEGFIQNKRSHAEEREPYVEMRDLCWSEGN